MISQNPESNCTNAQLYYYDFLSEETRGGIPENALKHIIQCQNCKVEIDRLQVLYARLDERIENEQSRKNSAITTLLKLHFSYIGEPVKCNTVKPFLASLADPALQIRVSTPITMHLNECQACSDDLLSLRDLHLTHKQLCRLGQLLAEKPIVEAGSCSQAQAAISSVVSMDFCETNTQTLKHLCTCPDCRKQIYLNREEAYEKLLINEMPQKEFPCEKVSTTDIYDYCLPYGIDPADDQYAEFRESLTSHLHNCPTCLAKMQSLHNTIYSIAERPNSKVVTCSTLQEQFDEGVESQANGIYADGPINVQVFNQEELTDTSHTETLPVAFTKRPKQKALALNLKQYIKPTIAAAAVILIAFALFFSTPAAKAVDLSQIYEALEKVKNVCISRFLQNETEPIQKLWVSQTLNKRLISTAGQYTLWDFVTGEKKTKFSDTRAIQIDSISPEAVTKGKESVKDSLGLLPFSDISAATKDSQWNRVDDKGVAATVPGTEVYDLTWSKTATPTVIEYYKWRAFIDIQTNLPGRIEWYSKTDADGEYELRSINTVSYPTDDEIKAVIQSTFE